MSKQRRPEIKRGAWVFVDDVVLAGHGPFRVMTAADGYAMLRSPGCFPFVAPFTQLAITRGDLDHEDWCRYHDSRGCASQPRYIDTATKEQG